MYLPLHFAEQNRQTIFHLMHDNPLATVIVAIGDDLVANEIPLLVTGKTLDNLVLTGHIAKNNPLSTQLKAPKNGLVLFRGGQHYISPSWYPTKKEHGKVVPTWDYAIIECRGMIELIDDEDFKIEQVTELTEKMEPTVKASWSVSDAPKDYLKMMLGNIVGIRITVERVDAKTKANQNHPIENKVSAAVALREIGSDESIRTARLIERASKSSD